MDTVLLSAILAGVAVFFGLMALFPGPSTDGPRFGEQIRAWQSRRVADAAEVLAQARLCSPTRGASVDRPGKSAMRPK
jgi:Zn-dependent protease